jgi:hypothetical protein
MEGSSMLIRRLACASTLSLLAALALSVPNAGAAASAGAQVVTYKQCFAVGDTNNFCTLTHALFQFVSTPGHDGPGSTVLMSNGFQRQWVTGDTQEGCFVTQDNRRREIRHLDGFNTQVFDFALDSSMTFDCGPLFHGTCTLTDQFHYNSEGVRYVRTDFACKSTQRRDRRRAFARPAGRWP